MSAQFGVPALAARKVLKRSNMRMLIGIAFLLGGLLLIGLGISASGSLASRASEFFTGDPTDRTLVYWNSGGIVLGLGVAMLAVPKLIPRR